jgi:uncharacterized protein with LGFP repeats
MKNVSIKQFKFSAIKDLRIKYLFLSIKGLVLLLFASTAMAFAVYGLIGDKYKLLGGQTGLMGAALNDESPAANGGRFNRFQHGYIYWHPNIKTGAHMVFGAIADKYRELGLERSPIGYPTTDEFATAKGGRRNNFQGGLIIWSQKTGARAVYGLIGAKWLALGAENSLCGFPTSDEQNWDSGVRNSKNNIPRISYFERGHISWSPGQKEATAECWPKGFTPGNPTPSVPPVSCVKGSKFCP